MIKFCNNREFIVKLWQEAFGDSTEDIEFFIDNVRDAKCLMYFEEGSPASMLYLVKCKAEGSDSNYIYAACTLSEYKGRGCMSKLINYCFDNGIEVCLIPANDGLIEFYTKRRISHKFSINDIKFEQIPEIEEYLFEGYKLTIPTALRS